MIVSISDWRRKNVALSTVGAAPERSQDDYNSLRDLRGMFTVLLSSYLINTIFGSR